MGCPSDSAIKARDYDGNGDTENVDKDQIGGVFWSIDPVIVCKQQPSIHHFGALINYISTGEGEGCPL